MNKFSETYAEVNNIVKEEGSRIFKELRKKYSNDSTRDLNIILNTLCYSLIISAKKIFDEKDYGLFIELVKEALDENLR